MAPSQRHNATQLIDWISQHLHEMDVWQVLRLLKVLQYKHAEMTISISNALHMHFPNKNIESISYDDAQNQVNVTINYFGLVGAPAILPTQYTVLLLQHKRLKNTLLKKIIDVIQKNSIHFYHESWAKSRIYLHHENHRLGINKVDYAKSALQALAGIQPNSNHRFRNQFMLSFLPFYMHRARSVDNLERLLSSYLKLAISIQEYTPYTVQLAVSQTSQIQSTKQHHSRNAALGQSLIIGSSARLDVYHFTIYVTVDYAETHFYIQQRKALLHQIQEVTQSYIGKHSVFNIRFRFTGKCSQTLAQNFLLP